MNNYIEMTKELSYEQLSEVVGIMAVASPEANGALLDYLERQGINNPEKDSAQRVRIKKAEESFLDIWEDAVVVLEAMEEDDWEELTARGFTDYYFEDANIDSQISQLEEIVSKNTLSPEFRREMIDQMMYDISGKDYGNDDALDLMESMCQTDDELLLLVDLLEEYDSWGSSDRIKRIYRDLDRDDELIGYMESEIQIPQNAIDLYNIYLKRGDRERAIGYLWEGLNLSPYSEKIIGLLLDISESTHDTEIIKRIIAPDTKWLRYDHDNLAKRIFDQLKQNAETEMLSDYVFRVFMGAYGLSDASYWFEKCITHMNPDAFDSCKSEMLDHLKKYCPADYYCYRIKEGSTEEALEALMNDQPELNDLKHYRPLDIDLKISGMLLDSYPDEIEELYWQKAELYGNNRDCYYRCARILLTLKEIAINRDHIEVWEQRFNSFVGQRKRRKYLIADLKKVGLL